MRTLDDVYGPDLDEFPLEQDTEGWDEDAFNLDWEEDETQEVFRDVVQGR